MENVLPRYAAGLLLMVIFRRRRINNAKKIKKETSGLNIFMEKPQDDFGNLLMEMRISDRENY